jgi:hypothetical protein
MVRCLQATSSCTGPASEKISPEFEVDIKPWTRRVALEIIGLAAIGKNSGALIDSESELCKIFDAVFAPNKSGRILAFLSVTTIPSWMFRRLPIPENSLITLSTQKIHDICRGGIQQARDLRDSKIEI